MKIDNRLLNLIGLLVIVAVLALGLTAIAMPIFERVQIAQGEIATDQQNNDALRARLAELTAAEQRQGEIEDSIAELRKQLPESAQTDTALQMIENSLISTGAVVRNVAFGEPVPFSPRAAYGEQGTAAPSTAPATPPADGTEQPDAAAEAPAAQSSTDARQQYEVSLSVVVPDEATALAFLDRLRADTRIMLPVEAALSKGSDSETGYEGRLEVKLLVFFYQTGGGA